MAKVINKSNCSPSLGEDLEGGARGQELSTWEDLLPHKNIKLDGKVALLKYFTQEIILQIKLR